jgi:hypothetical protein
MEKIIFLIWDDAKYHQTLIFMAQFFTKEGKNVTIIHRESINSKLGPIDFGKKNNFVFYSKIKQLFYRLLLFYY